MAFYVQENPKKISEIDSILTRFAGQDAKVIRKLERKYQRRVPSVSEAEVIIENHKGILNDLNLNSSSQSLGLLDNRSGTFDSSILDETSLLADESLMNISSLDLAANTGIQSADVVRIMVDFTLEKRIILIIGYSGKDSNLMTFEFDIDPKRMNSATLELIADKITDVSGQEMISKILLKESNRMDILSIINSHVSLH